MFPRRNWLVGRASAILISLPALAAPATRSLSGVLQTADTKRLPHIELRLTNIGSTLTTDSGEFKINLPPNVEAGEQVLLYVKDWVFVDPYGGKMYLPKSTAELVKITVCRKGDARVLDDPRFVQRIVEAATQQVQQLRSNRSSLDQPSSSSPPPAFQDEFLANTARELGLSMQQLKSAIGGWSKNVQEPYQKGLAALYAGRYGEASRNIQESINNSENEFVEKYVALSRAEYEQGHYPRAEAVLLKARAIRADSPVVLDNLGKVLLAEARYAEAEPLLKRAKEIDERVLGPEHSDFARDLSHLAWLSEEQGRYAEAEALYKRALVIDEKAEGLENPDVARDLNNLAWLYERLGRYVEGESLAKRAQHIDEKVTGSDGSAAANDLRILALLYSDQGKHADAEVLYRRALEIHENTLGPNHASVAGDLQNLAVLYHHWGKHEKEESLYKRALAIDEGVFGLDHPKISVILNSLAELYRTQAQYDEAAPLYERARRISEAALGPEHPDVAMIVHNIAAMYKDQGKNADAEPLFRRALAIYEKALGPEHPDVAIIAENLASALRGLGRDTDANAYEDQASKIRAKTGLGPKGKTPNDN